MLANFAKEVICYVLIFIDLDVLIYVLICEKIMFHWAYYFVLIHFGMLHFLLGQYDYQCQCGVYCLLCLICISCSESVAAENKMPATSAGDGVSSSLQPSPVYQSAWMGVPGQVSMADIVKMGRPQNKASIILPHQSVNHHHATAPPPAASHNDFHSSENYASKVVEITAEPEIATSQHNNSNNEWPSIEQPPAATASSVRDVPADSELYGDLSNLPLDRGSQHVKSQLNAHVESFDGNHVAHASISTRNMEEDGSGCSSLFDNDINENINSLQSDSHAFENNEGKFLDSSIISQLHSTISFEIQTSPHVVFR